jgi:RNase P subunit RPR2
MAGRRRSRRRKSDRKNEAEAAIRNLSDALEGSIGESIQIADSAARQILSIGKKHGVRPDSGIKRNICRTCKKSLSHGNNSRVRISSKRLIITCLECGRVARQGPDFGGQDNE